ncbi:unnamed protein product [Clonostachys byssicola]|uniref:Major facilitator superfamily (MFS) profile domain-containing protein n=1 Tax=Clonostachys byssicola TaxID=160290 RepID=A0A9N9UCZ3_9HYPO|nr:unnamed protein product [Clonostachys byssicola]
MGGLISLESFTNRFDNPSPGALAAFIWGDRFGRRWAIIYSCMVLLVGAALQTSAYWKAMYIVGRIVAGVGVGCISVTVPIYASECAHPSWRGKLVVLETTMVIIGIAISNFTNFGFVFGRPELDGTEAQWRIPLGLQMIFPPFVFALMPFTVESPRWLAARGRHGEVAHVLARLHGQGSTAESPHIQEQANIIVQTAIHEAEVESSWKECFSGGELQNFRRLILAATTGFLHQATGINVVIYYAPVIFRQVGLDDRNSFILSCVGSICFLLGSVLPIFYIERLGRRKTMMMGAVTCGLCMGMIACTGAVGANFPERAIATGWAGAAFVLLFQFCFGIGWNSMNWLYSSEIGSLRMRNKTSATQCLFHWGTNFLTVMVAPSGFAYLGCVALTRNLRKFYLVWMAVTLAAIPFLLFCFPETAGRTLEQMDEFFKRYPQWNIRKVAHNTFTDSAVGEGSEKEAATVHHSEERV